MPGFYLDLWTPAFSLGPRAIVTSPTAPPLRLPEAVRSRDGGSSTSQGRSYGIFQKAIQRRNVVAALAAARELPQLSLDDALELTLLVARKDPPRHSRIAAR